MLLRFTVTTIALAVLAAAAPQSIVDAAKAAVPITKRMSWLSKADGSVDFAALDAHIASAEAKIRRGRDNFARNTGSMHLDTVNEVRKRDGAGEPLSDVNLELWYGTISIGDPGQSFTVAFSTASSDLVVPSSTCDSSCNGHTLFDASSSSSSHDLGLTFNIGYGDGSSTSGEQYTDDVTIAGLTATRQIFGAATTYSTGLQSSFFPPDGVLGMAFESISALKANPVMQTLGFQGQVNPQFSFMLSTSGGELYIGGTNSAWYTGDFVWVDVLGQGFWEVQMDFIEGNGITQAMYIDCVIDTGTTAVIGIGTDVETMYTNLGGKAVPSNAGYYSFPCTSFPNVTLWFGMSSFPISASNLNLGPVEPGSSDCLSGIIASQNPNATSWILGDVFLMNVYTTFDFSTNQVGFAQLGAG